MIMLMAKQINAMNITAGHANGLKNALAIQSRTVHE